MAYVLDSSTCIEILFAQWGLEWMFAGGKLILLLSVSVYDSSHKDNTGSSNTFKSNMSVCVGRFKTDD